MVGRGGSGASIGVAATSSIGKGVVEVALVEGKARLRVCRQDGAGQVPCEAASTTGSVADLA